MNPILLTILSCLLSVAYAEEAPSTPDNSATAATVLVGKPPTLEEINKPVRLQKFGNAPGRLSQDGKSFVSVDGVTFVLNGITRDDRDLVLGFVEIPMWLSRPATKAVRGLLTPEQLDTLKSLQSASDEVKPLDRKWAEIELAVLAAQRASEADQQSMQRSAEAASRRGDRAAMGATAANARAARVRALQEAMTRTARASDEFSRSNDRTILSDQIRRYQDAWGATLGKYQLDKVTK